MSVVEELPDDHEQLLAATAPALPPHLAEVHHQTVDEVVRDLKRTPFFMSSIDDAGDEPNPELDAIKALIHEGARGEIAENFREQGNEFARAKQWSDGKELYSKGLAALKVQRKAEDPTGPAEDAKEARTKELLLVNRALCHLELQNYRSCVMDCFECIKLAPRNVKAHYRMACALLKLVKLPEALITANAGLKIEPSNKALETVIEKIKSKEQEQAAIEARRRAHVQQIRDEGLALSAALKDRGITYRKSPGDAAPDLPDDAVMRLDADALNPKSSLIFPVTLLYPLHLQSDFIKAFNEDHSLAQHLEYLLPLPWDAQKEYLPKSVDAYLETIEGGLMKWGKNVELGKVLGGGKVEVLDGIVRVNIVPRARASEWIDSLRKKKKGTA